jgi:Mg2+-importing ATPase
MKIFPFPRFAPSRLPATDPAPSSHSTQRRLARSPADEVPPLLGSSLSGLSELEAQRRLEQIGPHSPNGLPRETPVHHFFRATRNPLVLLLSALAVTSGLTGDYRSATVIGCMVLVGVILRFVQENRAVTASEKLRSLIPLTATVLREGMEREIPIGELVPGDVLRLSAGDMLPADVRLLSARDLFVAQATLTGESLPVEKHAEPELREDLSLQEMRTLCFMGSSVESGSATAMVVATGPHTLFGALAQTVTREPAATQFDRGVEAFTWMLIRILAVMVPSVFFVSGLFHHNWRDAFFFALAVAVGLTPEMLPMIVSVCLSNGTLAMARRKVVVKHLSAIQNFGAMDVLCTDKTGTLTRDRIILERHCDVNGCESDDVFLSAHLIAHFQTGLHNALDRAVLAHPDARPSHLDGYRKLDELPFDFKRRMMSVAVQPPHSPALLLTKGAPETVFERCTHFSLQGNITPISPDLTGQLTAQCDALCSEGFRVLAVAQKPVASSEPVSAATEQGLILQGYIAFLDPPKESAGEALAALHRSGIEVKVLTGDHPLLTRKICTLVGIDPGRILLGSDVETLSDSELAVAAGNTRVFARLAPLHKQRILQALQSRGHCVGYLGDGINDAPALHVADVGISVDSAVDIAKAAAGVVLLEKNLGVLNEGVLQGRKVFVNILKYLRMGASSSFGNMLSMLGASFFLPFLPMAPLQILTNSLLYDFSQIPIPSDRVAPQETAAPLPWDLGSLRRTVFIMGPLSSLFDCITFLLLWFVLDCSTPERIPIFQTGWFVESLITQTLVIHSIRNKGPLFRSPPASWQLYLTSTLVVAIAFWLPSSALGKDLGFVPLPPLYWILLLTVTLAYLASTEAAKFWLAANSSTAHKQAHRPACT